MSSFTLLGRRGTSQSAVQRAKLILLIVLYFPSVSFSAFVRKPRSSNFVGTNCMHLAEHFTSHIGFLYDKYADEIRDQRKRMVSWCERSHSCKFCDFEAEMLFIMIREIQPNHIFEMSPNRGYSSMWILEALQHNGRGHLTSLDIHDTCTKFVPQHAYWTFVKSDIRTYIRWANMEVFDFLFIDALHTEAFARWYTVNLLHNRLTAANVMIHDIVAGRRGGGRESWPVFQFLAYSHRVSNVFTLNSMFAPNPFDANATIEETLSGIRYKHGFEEYISFPCSHSPSIFFYLNAKNWASCL